MEERVLPPDVRIKIVVAQANAGEDEEEMEEDVSPTSRRAGSLIYGTFRFSRARRMKKPSRVIVPRTHTPSRVACSFCCGGGLVSEPALPLRHALTSTAEAREGSFGGSFVLRCDSRFREVGYCHSTVLVAEKT